MELTVNVRAKELTSSICNTCFKHGGLQTLADLSHLYLLGFQAFIRNISAGNNFNSVITTCKVQQTYSKGSISNTNPFLVSEERTQ